MQVRVRQWGGGGIRQRAPLLAEIALHRHARRKFHLGPIGDGLGLRLTRLAVDNAKELRFDETEGEWGG